MTVVITAATTCDLGMCNMIVDFSIFEGKISLLPPYDQYSTKINLELTLIVLESIVIFL